MIPHVKELSIAAIDTTIGFGKDQTYLAQFNYGNQDFSGDPGKNNGLTHAWLSSSLKISGEQRLAFLLALVHNQLPVTQDAMTNTKENIYLATSAHNTIIPIK